MDDERTDAGEQFRLLRESLGSLMLLWVRLENALADACHSASGRRLGDSFHSRALALRAHLEERMRSGAPLPHDLMDLADRIERVRRTRNLIVHSLAGVSADPARGEPHITCEPRVAGRGSFVRITQRDLARLLADIDRCRFDLGLVGSSRT